jgi:glyceraldehyde 3-phosphate dehydrogenase
MDAIRIGINGFGRIGRCVLKQMLDGNGFRIVGVNDLADISDLAYLLKYDSVHGWYRRKVEQDGRHFGIDGQEIPFFSQADPREIPWDKVGAEIVIEGTGAFRAREQAARHLQAGARKVLISAPSADADGMFVYGVNSDGYDADRHHVVSNASCTTNCLAPVAKVLLESFGVEHIMITTVHAYTASQALMDTPMRKRRRGRSAALSIVPTTTGAAKATARVLPQLEGRIDGIAVRVPVPDGSLTDIVALLEKDTSATEINDVLLKAAESGPLRGVLRVSDQALVSRDILGDPHSSIVDAESTMVLRGRVAKVLSWYDNEWGYSARLVDMARLVAGHGR